MIENYANERHFLQTVHMPAFEPPGRPFVYMKNHKAACTTVLATLMRHLAGLLGETVPSDLDALHTPTRRLIRAGPRRVSVADAMAALSDPGRFRFTIVRDPVARTVSAWADKIAGRKPQLKRLNRYLGRESDAEVSLDDFIVQLATDPGALDLDRHWRPQRREISFDAIDWNFIGNVSSLDTALAQVVQIVFKEELRLADTRKTLSHKTGAKAMAKALTRRQRSLIEAALVEDFEMVEDVARRWPVSPGRASG